MNRLRQTVGFLTAALGILANPWTVGKLATSDGTIGWVGYWILIWAVDAVLVTAGLYLALRSRKRLSGDAKNLALAGASTVVAFLLAELLLRWTPGPLFHPSLHLYPYRNYTFEVDIPGVSPRVEISTNAWGLRGDPIPPDWAERPTIVAVGGSTTKCSFLSDGKTWPARLQDYLRQDDPNVMVQNAGLSGHSTHGHRLLMERVIARIRPSMVIFLVGVNDLAASFQPGRLRRYERSPGLHYTLFASSRVVQLLTAQFRILVNRTPVELGGAARRLEFGLAPLEGEAPQPDDLDSLLPSLPRFAENVEALLTDARSLDVEPVFLTQPLLYGDGPEWERIRATTYWFGEREQVLSAATWWRLLERFNDTLLEICAARQVACFDLASAVPHEREYFYDEMHLTEAGAELVAREVHHFMAEGGVMPRQAARPTETTQPFRREDDPLAQPRQIGRFPLASLLLPLTQTGDPAPEAGQRPGKEFHHEEDAKYSLGRPTVALDRLHHRRLSLPPLRRTDEGPRGRRRPAF